MFMPLIGIGKSCVFACHACITGTCLSELEAHEILLLVDAGVVG